MHNKKGDLLGGSLNKNVNASLKLFAGASDIAASDQRIKMLGKGRLHIHVKNLPGGILLCDNYNECLGNRGACSGPGI